MKPTEKEQNKVIVLAFLTLCFYLCMLLASEAQTINTKRAKINCTAITEKNTYCLMLADSSGLCRFHSPIKVKCKSTTKKGTKCKNFPAYRDTVCYIHKPKTN